MEYLGTLDTALDPTTFLSTSKEGHTGQVRVEAGNLY